MHGGAGDDWLFGEAGQDQMDGGSGKDVLFGGTDSDSLDGGDGDDVLVGDLSDKATPLHGDDRLSGGAGDDRLQGDGGHDQLFGGDGDDELQGDGKATPVYLHGDDFLDGGAGSDTLWGHGGADQLLGGTGDDGLWGDDGPSFAIDKTWHGQDLLMGEEGDDLLVGGGAADTLLGGAGDDWLYGDDVPDVPGLYTVDASAHGNDWLDGGAGNDQLVGGGGRDQLLGGEGDDVLKGGDGDDFLDGGSGLNHLAGGSGNDTYAVRGADLAQPAPATDQPFDVRTTLSDSQGSNLLRVDARQSDISLLPGLNADGSTGVCMVWRTGIDAQGQPQVAVLAMDSLRSAASFTVEFSDGQRVAFSRWVGDALQAEITEESPQAGDLLTGAAGNDHLGVYGAGSQVMGGRGDDTITLGAEGSVVRFDRGDGHDVLQGWYGEQHIAFGAGIRPEDLSVRLTPQGRIVIAIADVDGAESGDRLELPVSSWGLPSNGFLADVGFADGRTLTWRDLLAQGVRIEADPNSIWVTGTDAKDQFSGVPANATLAGGAGDDQYHLSAGERATVRDSQGLNRIVFSADAASDWAAVGVQRAAPTADGLDSNDLLLSAGGATIRLSDALTQGDRFEIALSDGQARPLAELVRGLGSMGVEDGWDNGYLIGGDGDDLLRGQGGQDTLSGQGGSDALLGGEGDDLYLIDFDPGHDQIIDLQGRNTVRFGPGVPADAVRIERVGDGTDLRLSLDDECSVTVRRALEGAVVRYEFDDGSAWTLDNLIGRLGLSHGLSLVGTSGSDELVGTVLGDFISAGPGDDSLSGGPGDDELRGGAGDDRYRFQLGDGVDRLIDPEGASELHFGPGITPEQLSAAHETLDGTRCVRLRYSADDNLLIRDDMPLDGLRFFFDNGEVRQAHALYAEILMSDGAPLVGSAGDDVLVGYASADVLQGLDGMDTLQGGAGNDRLDGGAGSDHLYGGHGQDSYVLRAGDGLDRLAEAPGQSSRLLLDGIAPEALNFGRIGNDLLVRHGGSNAAAFIQDAYGANTRWTLVDAQGREQDLLVLASQAIAEQTPAQSQAAFAAAADAQAGPMTSARMYLGDGGWGWLGGLHRTDEAGTFTEDAGTFDERVYRWEKTTQHTASDEADVVLGGERDGSSFKSELLATVERTETVWGQRFVGYKTVTTGSPDRFMSFDDYMVGADGVFATNRVSLVPDKTNGMGVGHLSVWLHGDLRTESIPVYESGWVTENRVDYYYRATYVNVRTVVEHQGGDGANHIGLQGSATTLVSAGGGDDVVESQNATQETPGYKDTGSPDWIDGGSGDDLIRAGAGDDELRGGLGNDTLVGGAGADVYVVDAMDDGWDVIDERAVPSVHVTVATWMYPRADSSSQWRLDPAVEAELRSLAGKLDEEQELQLQDGSHFEFDMPATADKLNALMRLDQRPLRFDASSYSAIDSPDLDGLIARVSGRPLVSYSNPYWSSDAPHPPNWGSEAPRPPIHFDDQSLRSLDADTVRLGPGIDPGALQASWSTVDTEEGPCRALTLSWGGPGGVHVLMPEDGAIPGAGIECFEFADGTVWSMEQMVALVSSAPKPVVAAVSEWPALASGNDRWRDIWALGDNGASNPLSQGVFSGAELSPAQATFEAQFNNLIHAMAAFAPPPMASFTPSSDTQASAFVPVLAANPF